MTKPEEMDTVLWGLGEAVSRWYGRRPGRVWELDFVRGLHEQSALRQLAIWIGQHTGQAVRLHSIWMDKHAWVSWDAPDGGPRRERRELADLAVIIRRHHSGKRRVWMWVAQAKRVRRAFGKYTGESSKHEIELLHGMPTFRLEGVDDVFELTQDFPPGSVLPQVTAWPEVSVPWTFIDFDSDPAKPGSAMSMLGSPIVARWTAGPPESSTWAETCGFQGATAISYAQCLASLVLAGSMPSWTPAGVGNAQTALYPGAPVDSRYPQWSRLYRELIGQARRRPSSGHAKSGGNPYGSVLQSSTQFLSVVQERGLWPMFDADEMTPSPLRFFVPNGVVGGCALSEPYSEALGGMIAKFDGESEEELRGYDEHRDDGHSGGGGDDGPSDEGPGSPGVTLIVDVLGESVNSWER